MAKNFDPTKPYNDLPPLPPKAELETSRILKKAIAAHRTLAQLKGIGELLPDQSILINPLILEEAKDSSAIENVLTTRDKLYKALALDPRVVDPRTKEVLRYREALWNSFGRVKKSGLLTTNLIIDVQKTIVENRAGIRKVPGTRIINEATREVIYAPPEGEIRIRDLMKNLEHYIHSENETDPLIKMAVIHYQIEAIHPFHDGNGRTGRIVNVLYLILKDLLELPILYLSSYVIRNKGVYYSLLRKVTTDGLWEDWILFMLDAVEQTSRDTIDKVDKIKNLLEKTVERVRKEAPKIYSKELVELLFRQPYSKINFLVERGIAERKAAARYLNALEEIGVLKSKQIWKEKLFVNVRLYELLSGRQNARI